MTQMSKPKITAAIIVAFVISSLIVLSISRPVDKFSFVANAQIPLSFTYEYQLYNSDFELWENGLLESWQNMSGNVFPNLNNPPALTGHLDGDLVAEGVVLSGSNTCIIEQRLTDFDDEVAPLHNKTIDFSFRFRELDVNRTIFCRAAILLQSTMDWLPQVNGSWSRANDPDYWDLATVRTTIPTDVIKIVWRIEAVSNDGLPVAVIVDTANAVIVSGWFPIHVATSFGGGEAWFGLFAFRTPASYIHYIGTALFITSKSFEGWWIESLRIEMHNDRGFHSLILESNNLNASVFEIPISGSYADLVALLDSGFLYLNNDSSTDFSTTCTALETDSFGEYDRNSVVFNSQDYQKQLINIGSFADEHYFEIKYPIRQDWVKKSMVSSQWISIFPPPYQFYVEIRWSNAHTINDIFGNQRDAILSRAAITSLTLNVSGIPREI